MHARDFPSDDSPQHRVEQRHVVAVAFLLVAVFEAGGGKPVVETLDIRSDPIETMDEVVEGSDMKRVASGKNGNVQFLAHVKCSVDLRPSCYRGPHGGL